ncbi:MAG TPA: C39 family peptidase [Candidatus Elarobacter sp.]|jgi:hypothetical protein
MSIPPSLHAVVSWNADEPSGEIALIAHRADGSVSEPLPFVRWAPDARCSRNGRDNRTRIEVDVVRSDVPLTAIGVASTVDLDCIAVTVPPSEASSAVPPGQSTRARQLDVPQLSQYLAAFPGQRGWCSAASLAMLLSYHGALGASDVPAVARAIFDGSYAGTGNWAFNAAHAGARGLRGVVAYLRGIEHAAAFLSAGLPVAISIGWERDELPGAPLEHSAGHLLVVRGVVDDLVAVNDPAHPDVATSYPRTALDRLFRAHGGIAYLVAPRERTAELVALANAAAP